MSLHQLILVLRARWLMVVSILIATVGIVLIVSLQLPKRYTANTAVVADTKSFDPVAGVPVQFTAGYTATQVDIIQSERTAQRVVALLDLAKVPEIEAQWRKDTEGRGSFEQWMALDLIGNLSVAPSRDSSVINISFTGSDPKFAAEVANAFTKAYIDLSLELKVEPAKQYAAWFDARVSQLREKLEAAQEALSTYQRNKGIVASDEKLDYETTRLNEISSQLTQIQALRADTSSRQEQAGAGNENVAEVLQSPVIATLKTDLVRAEATWEDAQVRLGTSNPAYLKAKSDVASLRERIAQETARVASSLASANQVNIRREQELSSLLDAQKTRVLRLKEGRDGITALQRDVESAQKAYDAVSQGLAQSSLESQVQQTNIAVLTPAEPPLEPSSPMILLNTLLAFGAGTVLGIAAALLRELMQRPVRSFDDLTETLGLPVLAVIGGDGAVGGSFGRGFPIRQPPAPTVLRLPPGRSGRVDASDDDDLPDQPPSSSDRWSVNRS